MYLWVGLAAVWGMYRGYQIFKVLRKTTYKTERNRDQGAMASRRGHTVLSTLKEHMFRQVAFLGFFCIFAFINILYAARRGGRGERGGKAPRERRRVPWD
jgi:hypothetical protein